MELSEDKIKGYIRRILLSRVRILCDHGFYGLLLMHMKFAVDEKQETAATDGERIILGAGFLEKLSDKELDFILMHEVLHVALEHCSRGKNRDHELFNVACDIVVNSMILKENDWDVASITLKNYGESRHYTPDGQEGAECTAEQVYAMLLSTAGKAGRTKEGTAAERQLGAETAKMEKASSYGSSNGKQDTWDDHSRWHGEAAGRLQELWQKRVLDAARAMEEITDYSFAPPDRRYQDSSFFLPEFNEKEEYLKDVLFMIDTSGSMSDEMLTAVYSEVKGALEQFGGRLQGWLGFFDAEVTGLEPFMDEESFQIIRPKGGGGTDYKAVFDYVTWQMKDVPASIIILTDGYAPFPEEGVANGVPVLWLFTMDRKAPWGKWARIEE